MPARPRPLAIVLGLALLMTMLAVPSAGMAAPQPTLYLALGESTQAGVGASDPDHASTALFFAYLQRVGAAQQFVNLAIPGETSDMMVAGPDSQLAQALAVINDPGTDVTVVTLAIGGNDVPFDICIPAPESAECQAAAADAMATLARNLDTILRQLQQALAKDPGRERIILQTYYQPLGGTGDPIEDAFDVLWQGPDLVAGCSARGRGMALPTPTGLNDAIACIGRRNGVTVVDLFALFGDRALELTHIGEGDLHPNDLGHATIAAALVAAYETGRPR